MLLYHIVTNDVPLGYLSKTKPTSQDVVAYTKAKMDQGLRLSEVTFTYGEVVVYSTWQDGMKSSRK